ncbi:pyridoxamine 5'-phosphate oxidase family protein [Winogradskyella jejuensis]|uniref:Flavin mononucleotide-binding protein n=1 Tax=Winogradskyella jejuensis TaxID=1089305 RepID=A0A1M5UWA9_9FLAO|nr:pyridoxamine 5'-phosphate oxidase family protein [Winogradskyella jejuensis]SHH67158.1 hypothetical protein SAMN05444148_2622 [Winogradskyella jejuensis]
MIRALKDIESKHLLANNYIGHLSYLFKDKPYVLPITYYYDVLNNIIIGYSGKGHKIRALRINNQVAMEVSEIESVNNWKSILVQGSYKEFEGSTAKINLHKFSEGVKEVISKKEGKDLKFLSEFSSKIYKEGPPIVFKINVEEITGRERKYS